MILGLRRAGTGLGDADLIVGTSIGSFIAAFTAFGGDLSVPSTIGREKRPMPEITAGQFTCIFDVPSDVESPTAERRRKALDADTAAAARQLDAALVRLLTDGRPGPGVAGARRPDRRW
ncbi:hypothetical protein [Actinomadura rubteroloni]|uniref:hypothetical protein n=1 Tax=Actinomadura rubteroloni TaxID=1926885 RepID=UPI000CD86D56|nr:hypothetical protein [Actinomadura rubteroloni]